MPRTVWTLSILALLIGACQSGGVATPTGATVSTPAANPNDPAPVGSAEPTKLDGTITYDMDNMNSAGGSSVEIHQHLNADVHLAVQDADHPFTFVDHGSTFTYTESSKSDDPQTVSSCGLHQESAGSGSGSFTPAGDAYASYPDYSPTVELILKVPYSNDASQKFLCNGLSQSDSSDEVTTGLSCNPGGNDWLEGTIEPGGVMKIAAGQTIDFACTLTSPIGSGSTKVVGKLTSS